MRALLAESFRGNFRARLALVAAALAAASASAATPTAGLSGSLSLRNSTGDANAPAVSAWLVQAPGASQVIPVSSQSAATAYSISALAAGRYLLYDPQLKRSLFTAGLSWTDGRTGTLSLPGAPAAFYSPLIPEAPQPQAPAQGVYADGAILLDAGEAETASFQADLAFLDGAAAPFSCALQPDLASARALLAGDSAGAGTSFLDETGASRTSLTGLFGATAQATASATGAFRLAGVPGPWVETGYLFQLLRDGAAPDAPDFLSEQLSLDVQAGAAQHFALSSAAPQTNNRQFPLGGATLRFTVLNADGSLRAFKEPHFSARGSSSDLVFGWTAVDQTTTSTVATQHVVQLVGPPGPANVTLSANVPDAATGIYGLTSFPSVDVTLRPPRADGTCQNVCVDGNSGQQFDDDQLPPRVTLAPALGATLHAGPHPLVVTAIDQSPVLGVRLGGATGSLVSQSTDPAAGLTTNVFSLTANVACGASSALLTVPDVCGEVAVRSFALNGTNTPPVFTLGAVTAVVGRPLSLVLAATDADGDPIAYAAPAGLPAGASLDAATHTLSWTPAASDLGVRSLTFTATDVCDTVSATTTITVLPNHPPILQPPGPLTVAETQPLSFTLVATDADLGAPGDTLTYSLTGLPAHAAFNAATQKFSWTPGYRTAGTYPLVARVTDAGGLFDQQTLSLVVTKTNAAPVLAGFVDCNCNIPEGQLFTFPILATDANGDALRYSSPDLPPGAAIDPTTGLFTWTPDYTQASRYTVTVVATDNDPVPLSATAHLHLTVTNVNRAPIVAPIPPQTVAELATLSFSAMGHDPDNPITQRNPDLGDVLTWSAAPLPPGAVFNPSTQTLTWTPGYGAAGDYEVFLTLADDKGASDIKGAVIHVLETSRPPSIVPMAAQAGAENQPMSFYVSVNDPSGEPVTCTMGNLPEGAQFDAPNLHFSWTPGYDQSISQIGPVHVALRCCNQPSRPGGVPLCAVESVELDVAEVDRPPVLDPIPETTTKTDHLVSFELHGHDPDVESVLVYSSGELPHGAKFDAGSRKFSWTPDETQGGDYSIGFSVSDGQYTATQTAVIHVLQPDYSRAGGGFATSGCSSLGDSGWLCALAALTLCCRRRRVRSR